MVSAIILIECERSQVEPAAEQLAALEGISEVYSVAGRFDLVAIARASDMQELAHVVTRRLAQVSGIGRTETMVAMRAFSRHDLEAMFAIGMES
jgi:DNA-binding Lrp family transcriptional regulator